MLHPGDTMTAEETAAGGHQPAGARPRAVVPVHLLLCRGYAGITVHELWSEPRKYRPAIERCYRELGPWDVYYPVNPASRRSTPSSCP